MDLSDNRKIIHVDMDAFYASVEQMDNPDYRGKPIAVGGRGDRGVVAASSYEARKFGVKSAMSGALAKKLCPEIIFVRPRFPRYQELSQEIRKIFYDYTDEVEPLSLDEAYLDVTHNKKGYTSATLLAREIRDRILNEVGLNASAGISVNKFLAKIASDINKPNGQKTIPPEEVLDFIAALDIRKFYGVGKKTSEKMYSLGIFTGMDLRNKTEDFLREHFQKQGSYYYNLARGIHLSPVKGNRKRKSLAAERTFQKNLSSEIFVAQELEKIAEELSKRLEKNNNLKGKTLTLKIKFSDFSIHTRSKTIDYYIYKKDDLFNISYALLMQEKLKNSVRLVGLSLSNFFEPKEQLTLEL